MNASRHASSTKLTKSGISRLITVVGSLIATAAIFFAGAGTLDVPRAWIYYIAILVYLVIAIIVLLVAFPGAVELINERGKVMKKDVKVWDKFFALAYTLFCCSSCPP